MKSEIDVKKRLTEFKQLLSSQKLLTEFDRTVFESIVDKIIVGGVNSDGEIDPAMLTIIFKTGETQNKDGKHFKSKRKNAKLEPDKLCPQNSDEDKKLYPKGTDNTRRVCKLVGKMQIILKRFPEPFESTDASRGVCCSARKNLETFERKGV